MIQDKTIVTGTPIYRFVLFPMTMGDSAKCSMTRGGGNLRPRRPPLPASTSANTPANGNQRFHLRTESLWIPFQFLRPAVRIMQLNVEGLSAAKRRIIQSLAEIHHLLKTRRKRRMTRSIAPRGLSATADLVVS